MRSFVIARVQVTLAAVLIACAVATAGEITPAETLRITRHLVPLPQQITIQGTITVPRDQVAVQAPVHRPPLVLQARKELLESLGLANGKEAATSPSLAISLELGGADSEPLRSLPNADQAYRIIAREEKPAGLRLVAIEPRGLYYAAKTMQQLLAAGKTADAGTVAVPLATITDWPDMPDRGFWGGDSYEHLRWMSDRKLNYDEQIAFNGIGADKKRVVNLHGGKKKIIDEGPTYGINPVPVVLHLEQLGHSGLFEAYPELKGKNGRAGSICYSNPLFADILADWLLLWRAMPGVREVDVWMAENLQGEKGCQCESCAKEDRSVLEARAIVAGWKKALQKQPDLGLRVLTSEETEKANPKVFKELPLDVKLWYYHSLFTYNASERPMIRPYLLEEIARGRWVGVCPNICAQVGTWQPFTGAAFVHCRMNEFVDKKLSGLIAYAVPQIEHVAFNAEAAAEWTWHAKGRSPREYAVSWAVRQNIKDPEKFAQWSELHGAVAWDVYGSEYPAGGRRGVPGKAATLLKEGKLPALGFVLWEVYPFPWGDIRSVEQLDRDVAQAEEALRLARELGEPSLLQESLVVRGYINSLKALWELKKLVGPAGASDKAAASRWFKAYGDSLAEAAAALTAWERSLPGRAAKANTTGVTVTLVESMISEMRELAKEVGADRN